jgi:hypothetical protein
MSKTRWTHEDFEGLTWHDNYVHGLGVREDEYGAGRLVLDLDYTCERRLGADNAYSFLVAPAELTFYEVTDLAVHFDCRGIVMGPLSIDEILRGSTEEVGPYRSYRWRIDLNFPKGEMTFLSSGFVQELKGPPTEGRQQHLPWEHRGR